MCRVVLSNKAGAGAVCSLEAVGRKKDRSSGYCDLGLFFLLFYRLEVIEDAPVNSFQTENYEHSFWKEFHGIFLTLCPS